MLEEDKLALRNSTAAIRCKIIVKASDVLPEITLTDNDSIKDWTYTDDRYVPQQGFIGQFVARTLEGNLQNISDNFNIENREIELQICIVNRNKNTENWYSLGNFIVTNPEDNEVLDNTKFEAMDYTKLFNKRFDGDYEDLSFPKSYNELIKTESVTALWLAKYCCAQVGVEFGQTTFTNSDFAINQNPFQAGETCRDVLKEISKLAYSWVRIGWDNKCYIDFEPVTSNTVAEENIITNNHYYTLKTRKEIYGPINNVVVGMSGIDGESHSEKDPNRNPEDDEHTIYIYDNPLTNTFELRALAQKQASKLFGLTYTQLETETVGHLWLQGYEKINVTDMENNNNFTYPFNKTIKYSGHVRSTISSMGETEVEKTLAYESNVIKNTRNAGINVDKQNGRIDMFVQEISTSVDRLDTTINRVEKTTTANSETIKIISKNIVTEGDNKGDITEVTTTTGFTFNADGMTIDDGSGFKAEHRADGTYYKDGTSTVGQYTKNGSKQKDLQLFGVYSYGMRDKDDTPMFVAQLYTDEKKEECFGHFYNGGDY